MAVVSVSDPLSTSIIYADSVLLPQVIPCFGVDATFCAYLASHLGCVVLDADYRKAPAHPFPAGPQDAEDMCHYVIAHPELYDVTKLSVGGTSAGGNLALGTAAKVGPERIQAVSAL
jgi:acetyl esterase/lipase